MFKKRKKRKQKETYCEEETYCAEDILFKGKRIDNGEWVESSSITRTCYNMVYLGYGACWTEVIPESVGRFTGLKDKNKVKIFEGDILKISAGGAEYVKLVVFNNGAFRLKGEKNTLASYCCHRIVKIIGNIHDTETCKNRKRHRKNKVKTTSEIETTLKSNVPECTTEAQKPSQGRLQYIG